MITNNGVTFWHYDEVEENYIRTKITQAWAICTEKSESDGASGGQRRKAPCTIRIPTSCNLKSKIDIGDYVRLGVHDTEPDRCSDMKVVSLRDNRYGLSPHWRIECE